MMLATRNETCTSGRSSSCSGRQKVPASSCVGSMRTVELIPYFRNCVDDRRALT